MGPIQQRAVEFGIGDGDIDETGALPYFTVSASALYLRSVCWGTMVMGSNFGGTTDEE